LVCLVWFDAPAGALADALADTGKGVKWKYFWQVGRFERHAQGAGACGAIRLCIAAEAWEKGRIA
jgi:hypothetical protein